MPDQQTGELGPYFAPGTRVSVLTTQPLRRYLDYFAPEDGVMLGAYVRVPLGPRQVLGVVWGQGDGSFDAAKLKTITQVLDIPPMLPSFREFVARVAAYTMTSPEATLRLATRVPGLLEGPPLKRVLKLGSARPDKLTPARERVIALCEDDETAVFTASELSAQAGVSASVVQGLVKLGVLIETATPRDLPYPKLDPARGGKPLSDEQAKGAAALCASVGMRGYNTTLLKGVTGSGKTEVYLEAVAKALQQGRQALVLLPEIALTGEFLARVEARFGAKPAEWHSGVTQTARRRCWRAIARGEAQLVVGARSALFLPFRDLGLVVVDEEHDNSYKQEEGALYHARDMAVMRASLCGASVILASATPSLESWANADSGKYARVDLPQRFGASTLPDMAAIDLRHDKPGRDQWLSPSLIAAVEDRIARGEQSLMFLNRRGYAPLTMCRACGHQVGCHQCDARMVEHRFHNRLICHQCGETQPIPEKCPKCGNPDHLAALGPGVERLAEEASARFPDARVAVLSSDMSFSARALKERIEEIAQGGADIIIGTQMVAKGHNFPRLTLVGVVDADLGLQGGDLRAAEKTFQLIRQVAGRAGRADRPGEALIQTHQPDHPVIAAILSGDEEAFWKAEADARRAANMPPYGRMAGVIVSGPDEGQTAQVARELAQQSAMFTRIGADLLGPAPAPVAWIRGRARFRLLVRAPKEVRLQPTLAAWRARVKTPPNVRIVIDIDPMTFF